MRKPVERLMTGFRVRARFHSGDTALRGSVDDAIRTGARDGIPIGVRCRAERIVAQSLGSLPAPLRLLSVRSAGGGWFPAANPDSGGSSTMGPLRRAAGAQPRGSCVRVLEQSGIRDRDGQCTQDWRLLCATCMDEASIERRGSMTPLDPDLEEHRGAGQCRAPAGDSWPNCTRSASARSSNSDREADFKDSFDRAQCRGSGRPRPSRSRLLLQGRPALGGDPEAVRRSRRQRACLTLAGYAGSAGKRDRRRNRDAPGVDAGPICARSRRAPWVIPRAFTTLQDDRQRTPGALTPGFEWTRYLRGIGAPSIASVNVTEPDFFRSFAALVSSAPVQDLRTYLRVAPAERQRVPALSQAFVDENFTFYSKPSCKGCRSSGHDGSACVQLRGRWRSR